MGVESRRRTVLPRIAKGEGQRNRGVEGEVAGDVQITAEIGLAPCPRHRPVQPVRKPTGHQRQRDPGTRPAKRQQARREQPQSQPDQRHLVGRGPPRRQPPPAAVQRRIDHAPHQPIQHAPLS